MSNEIVDATLLPYQAENFLLPTIALLEIIPHTTTANFSELVTWRELSIPLVTFNMKPCDQQLIHPKMAILNALFSEKIPYPPYFAVLLERDPRRIKITMDMLDWIDETHLKAKLSINSNESTEVILVDLARFSRDVEIWLGSVK